jgi:hypothetical protein
MLELDNPSSIKTTAKKKIENFMYEVSTSGRDLFSSREVEDMLLDIYSCLMKDIS